MAWTIFWTLKCRLSCRRQTENSQIDKKDLLEKTMMNSETQDLLDRALKLPPEARAALAGSLIESLDESVDTDAEAAWESEIRKRIAEIDAGTVETIPWSVARQRILNR
jgi:putative addiction module component (TIGR02574 family)